MVKSAADIPSSSPVPHPAAREPVPEHEAPAGCPVSRSQRMGYIRQMLVELAEISRQEGEGELTAVLRLAADHINARYPDPDPSRLRAPQAPRPA